MQKSKLKTIRDFSIVIQEKCAFTDIPKLLQKRGITYKVSLSNPVTDFFLNKRSSKLKTIERKF